MIGGLVGEKGNYCEGPSKKYEPRASCPCQACPVKGKLMHRDNLYWMCILIRLAETDSGNDARICGTPVANACQRDCMHYHSSIDITPLIARQMFHEPVHIKRGRGERAEVHGNGDLRHQSRAFNPRPQAPGFISLTQQTIVEFQDVHVDISWQPIWFSRKVLWIPRLMAFGGCLSDARLARTT